MDYLLKCGQSSGEPTRVMNDREDGKSRNVIGSTPEDARGGMVTRNRENGSS